MSEGMPRGTIEKFHPDGRVKLFPGNTFVSAIDEAGALSHHLAETAARLQASPFGPRLAFLPRASYHMTVFEGICDAHRDAARWPGELSVSATLEEANAFIETRCADVEGIAGPLHMRVNGLTSWSGIVVSLQPASAPENTRLRALRDRLSEATTLRKPGHDEYVFHISLAYWLDRPSDDEFAQAISDLSAALRDAIPQIELPAPDFCHFETMYAFVPKRSLAKID